MEAGAAVGREARFHDAPGAVCAPDVPFDGRRLSLLLPQVARGSYDACNAVFGSAKRQHLSPDGFEQPPDW